MAEIRTRRLLLRPLRDGDAERIFVAFNNWEVVRRLAAPPWPCTIEDTRTFVARRLSFRSEPTEALHVIELANALIGGIDCTPRWQQQPGTEPVLGFWLAQPFWGKGYMTEAAAGFCREAIRVRGGRLDPLGSVCRQSRLFTRPGKAWLRSRWQIVAALQSARRGIPSYRYGANSRPVSRRHAVA